LSLQARPKPERPAPVIGKGHAKIDPALWDLSSKLVGGNYEQGAVKVKTGWVEVFTAAMIRKKSSIR